MSIKTIATIDLGSNSFHMMIVQVYSAEDHQVIARHKKKVQLRSGIEEDGSLSQEACQRALSCFEEFAQKLAEFNVEKVDIVGTYTLRAASNISTFIKKAEAILENPIRIISGEEEARLIYLGALLGQSARSPELVIDIGGGSTEVIAGEGGHPLYLHSFDMGCVSIQAQFFGDEKLTSGAFDAAIAYAKCQLNQYAHHYACYDYQQVIGTSGTITAVASVILARFGHLKIKPEHLKWLLGELIKTGQTKSMSMNGLRRDRENILPGGLSILIALFDVFAIESLSVSKSAIREGVLHEFISRLF